MVSAMLVGFALVVAGAAEPEAAKPAEADQAAYESARAAAGRDADAHVALALWCEAHGMAAEKATHLARAVLLDPSHARARGLLGYVKHDGKWMRPEEVSKAVEDSPEAPRRSSVVSDMSPKLRADSSSRLPACQNARPARLAQGMRPCSRSNTHIGASSHSKCGRAAAGMVMAHAEHIAA